jgi:uncharacterized damage-inducible protein DinB
VQNPHRTGAVGALLDVYEKTFSELQQCIDNIPDSDLEVIVDDTTSDHNCQSVQSVLSHIVSAAYSYAIYIRTQHGEEFPRPDKIFHSTIQDYINDFSAAIQFTVAALKNIQDADLCDQSNKIQVAWGQEYDIEQLLEHAIVHVLRHTRQIEKFKAAIRERETE